MESKKRKIIFYDSKIQNNDQEIELDRDLLQNYSNTNVKHKTFNKRKQKIVNRDAVDSIEEGENFVNNTDSVTPDSESCDFSWQPNEINSSDSQFEFPDPVQVMTSAEDDSNENIPQVTASTISYEDFAQIPNTEFVPNETTNENLVPFEVTNKNYIQIKQETIDYNIENNEDFVAHLQEENFELGPIKYENFVQQDPEEDSREYKYCVQEPIQSFPCETEDNESGAAEVGEGEFVLQFDNEDYDDQIEDTSANERDYSSDNIQNNFDESSQNIDLQQNFHEHFLLRPNEDEHVQSQQMIGFHEVNTFSPIKKNKGKDPVCQRSHKKKDKARVLTDMSGSVTVTYKPPLLECHVCLKEFDNKVHYYLHMEIVHKIKRQSSNPGNPTYQQCYQCQSCDRTFVLVDNLKKHMKMCEKLKEVGTYSIL